MRSRRRLGAWIGVIAAVAVAVSVANQQSESETPIVTIEEAAR